MTDKTTNKDVIQEPRIIYLNRQGVSRTVNTAQTMGLDFYIEIHQWQDTDRYIGEVCYSSDKKWADKAGQCAFVIPTREDQGVNPVSFATAKMLIEKGIKRKFKTEIRISQHIQAYMYKDDEKTPYAHTLTDFYFAKAVYCGYSNTIRAMDNSCLIAWDNEDFTKPNFNVDALNYENAQLMHILKKAHAEFLKEHNQRKSDADNKGWLAWLVSQYMKEDKIRKPMRAIKSMRPESYWNNTFVLQDTRDEYADANQNRHLVGLRAQIQTPEDYCGFLWNVKGTIEAVYDHLFLRFDSPAFRDAKEKEYGQGMEGVYLTPSSFQLIEG